MQYIGLHFTFLYIAYILRVASFIYFYLLLLGFNWNSNGTQKQKTKLFKLDSDVRYFTQKRTKMTVLFYTKTHTKTQQNGSVIL